MRRKDFSDLKIEVQNNKNSCFPQENYIAGVPPFLRGSSSTMFLQNSIKSKYIIKNPSHIICNTIIKEKIEEKYTEFTLKFDSKNNESGICINSIDDMISLLNEIPLDKISFTFNTNTKNIIPIIAFFICASEELGFNKDQLKFSIQLYSENLVPEQTVLNFLQHNLNQLPQFELISHLSLTHNKGFTKQVKLANLILNTSSYIKECISNNLRIDLVAPIFSFGFKLENDYLYNIAFMRASRLLWAKMMLQFQPKNQTSSALQIHIINSNSYLVTLSAILGGAQSIESSMDNSFFIEKETFITKTVDPFGGSNILEKLTEEIAHKTWNEVLKNQKNNSIKQTTEQVTILTENLLDIAKVAAKKRIKFDKIFELISTKNK